ncbi:MAG: hypothetical protein P8188_15520 [Gemmatimonadota bacterium]
MLSQAELVDLYRSLQEKNVLSVYLDTDQHDPADRGAWRTVLEGEVSKVARSLNGDEAGFKEAWSRIERELRSAETGFMPGRGLVAFATADDLAYVEQLPISTRTLVRWEQGIRAAPYIRALKQQRPITVALVDKVHARLFTYQGAELVEDEGTEADTDLGDLSDVGVRKSPSRNSGVRGETSTDQAQRVLDESTDRMLKGLVSELESRVSDDGILILGGTPEVVRNLGQMLPKRMKDRTTEQPSLHLRISLNELKDAVRQVASDFTAARQSEMVDEVLDAARSGGNGACGLEETERALLEMRVDTLLLSRDFVWDRSDYADRCVGTAFAQGANVVEVGGPAGERLQEEAGGMAARLRYRIRADDGAGEQG